MQFSPTSRTCILIAAITVCLTGQTSSTNEARGMPPRATPADYQAHAQVGALTLAAEFRGHSVPTTEGPLSTEDYVVVEIGFFGPAEARGAISAADFTLRVNDKKPLPSQPYGLVIGSVKDPEWVPPEQPAAKSKTSLGGGGGGGGQADSGPPPPVKIPLPVMRAMAQRVQKAALPEGDRVLPQAGLIFFQYRGKIQGIRSLELLYAGPAGKATLALQP